MPRPKPKPSDPLNWFYREEPPRIVDVDDTNLFPGVELTLPQVIQIRREHNRRVRDARRFGERT